MILRPLQWTKNLFCFAGLIFGGRLFETNAILLSSIVFSIFCFTASGVYIFNDIIDRKYDRHHPRKKNRPIASGEISLKTASIMGIIILSGCLFISYCIGHNILNIVIIYILNNIIYSLKLKHVPVLDVFSIGIGFVMRLMAGIYILDHIPTAWVVLCTFFLAIFLGFGKRRAEINSFLRTSLENYRQRPVIKRYSKEFLDKLINDSSIMSILCYAMFATTSGKNPTLIVTLPIVFYAISHYKYILLIKNDGEEPEKIIISDSKIWLSVLVWVWSFIIIFYCDLQLFDNIIN